MPFVHFPVSWHMDSSGSPGDRSKPSSQRNWHVEGKLNLLLHSIVPFAEIVSSSRHFPRKDTTFAPFGGVGLKS